MLRGAVAEGAHGPVRQGRGGGAPLGRRVAAPREAPRRGDDRRSERVVAERRREAVRERVVTLAADRAVLEDAERADAHVVVRGVERRGQRGVVEERGAVEGLVRDGRRAAGEDPRAHIVAERVSKGGDGAGLAPQQLRAEALGRAVARRRVAGSQAISEEGRAAARRDAAAAPRKRDGEGRRRARRAGVAGDAREHDGAPRIRVLRDEAEARGGLERRAAAAEAAAGRRRRGLDPGEVDAERARRLDGGL